MNYTRTFVDACLIVGTILGIVLITVFSAGYGTPIAQMNSKTITNILAVVVIAIIPGIPALVLLNRVKKMRH